MGRQRSKDLGKIIAGIKEFKKKANVEKAILFGSYARGDFTKNSDVDVILIGKRFDNVKFPNRFKGLWLLWDLGMPADFIPLTRKEFEKMSREVSIVSEAVSEGVEI